MIKRLKIRFIVLSAIALFLLLSLVVVGMNVINYYSFVNETDGIIELISKNHGRFPDKLPAGPGDRMPPHLSPETPHETRFFTVLVGNEGEIELVDVSKVVTVDEETAVGYAEKVLKRGRSRGFVGSFRYKMTFDGGVKRLTFLDCGRKLDAIDSFAVSSITMSLIGYAVIIVFVAIISGRLVRPVAESYEKQKRFITDAGHEMKTPITIISASLDLYEMENGENEYVSDIRQQTNRLRDLTGSLVYLSKMEETGKSLPMMEFPLSDVILDSVTSFKSLAQLKGKTLVTDVPEMLSAVGNEASVRQLISILIDNAMKYSPDGSEVTVTLRKHGKGAVLTVENDTVTPLSEADVSRIFDRFYRADASRNSATGGHGIGLSVAKAITEAHGGRIGASSVSPTRIRITAVI